MSRIVPEVWTRLAGERVQGETLWARRAAPDISERLVAALDADGQRHLLVLLITGEASLEDMQSRGVGVLTRELVMPGHEPGRYLDITCHDRAGHEAFDLIGGELAERLATATETAPEVVARVLAKWRRFWGQAPQQLLSRDEQIGLFAELWFLRTWLIPQLGVREAVTRWRGPFGARHDFESPGRSVEVKGTTSTRGIVHRIHGIEQLMPPETGELLFFSLRVREESGATNTLPGLVAVCQELLRNDDEASGRFESALVQIGYSSAHEPEYARFKLRIAEESLSEVRDDFPRLTPAHLTRGLPTGVQYVEYEINLSGFERLRIATRPSDTIAL